jgi:hypothetical protein
LSAATFESMLRLAVYVVLAGALAGCKKPPTAAPATTPEPELIPVAPPALEGYRWRRIPPQAGFGSVELPDGEGWARGIYEGLELINQKLDITVMITTQPDVGADSRAEYMDTFTLTNKRDVPKYEVIGRHDGVIKRLVAGRLDGRFDNGTAYVTRDYVLFARQGAFVVMVRGPLALTGHVRQLADHIAHSFE